MKLGDRGSRGRDPLDSRTFLGFERFETSELDSSACVALAHAFGEPACYECWLPSIGPDRALDFPVQLGFVLSGKRGDIRVLLFKPEQRLELATSKHVAAAALSTEGAARWRDALIQIARPSGLTPLEFYQQMRAPGDSLWQAPDAEDYRDAPVLEFELATLKRVPHRYPQLAREAGVDGTVRLLVLVGFDGIVKDVRIEKSIPMLDGVAVEAVRQWKFVPWKRAGMPAAAWTRVGIRFSLTDN